MRIFSALSGVARGVVNRTVTGVTAIAVLIGLIHIPAMGAETEKALILRDLGVFDCKTDLVTYDDFFVTAAKLLTIGGDYKQVLRDQKLIQETDGGDWGQPIDFQRAAAVLVDVLGYGYLAKDKGYVAVAQDKGILEGVVSQSEGPLSRETAVDMIYNALFVDMVKKTGFPEDPDVSVQKNHNLLTENLGANRKRGRITASYLSEDQAKRRLWRDEVLIDGQVYKTGYTNAAELVGTTVEFYEKDQKLICVKRSALITASETSGVDAADYFVRRGVPYPAGAVRDIKGLRLEDSGGRTVPAQLEVMSTHGDGSVYWLSVAFLAQLKPYETKEYNLVDGAPSRAGGAPEAGMSASVDNHAAVLSNGRLQIKTGPGGISEIRYKDKPVLQESGAALLIGGGEREYAFHSARAEIVSTGGVYTTVRVKGLFQPMDFEGELLITIYSHSDVIDYQFRFTAKSDLSPDTTALSFHMQQGFKEPAYDANAQSAAHEPGLKLADWCSLYHEEAGISAAFITRDNRKFFGAATQSAVVANGFIAGEDGRLLFAPFQYKAPWNYYDGVSRTFHLKMKLYEGEADPADLEAQKTLLYDLPQVQVDPEAFIKSGLVKYSELSPVVERFIDLVKFTGDKRWGRFEAGSIPYGADSEKNTVTMFDMRPGEVEYNLWKAYMLWGDSRLYDILVDSALSWADVVQYRGKYTEIYGANRYRSGSQYGAANFFGGQLYYGDGSGLYLTYLMSGDPYYRDCFKLLSDYVVRNLTENKILVHMGWTPNRGVQYRSDGCEVRVTTQVRPLHMAYEIFKDPKYLDAAYRIARYAADIQEEGGFWYQRYNSDNSVGLTGTMRAGFEATPMVKNYIMLYYMRSYCYLYDHMPEAWLKNCLERFGDYLLGELQEDGWMYDPSTVTRANEDDTRGNAPMQEIMAVEVLNHVYRITGDEKYLAGMLRALRYWIACQSDGGSAAQRYNLKDYSRGSITIAMQIGQNASVAGAASEIYDTLTNNREAVGRLGFEDVAAVFSGSAVIDRAMAKRPYPAPEFSMNPYRTPVGDIIYMVNHSGRDSGKWEKDVTLTFADNTNLWMGGTNLSGEEGLTVSDHLEQFGMSYLRRLPIKLLNAQQPVSLTVWAYNSEMIKLTAEGRGKFALEVSDGEFKIEDRNPYLLQYSETAVQLDAEKNQLIFDVDLGAGTTNEQIEIMITK